VAQARRRARRGELARALAEIGRATAYVPSHAGANALLKKLSAGRTILRVAGFVVAGLVLATTTWLAWHPPWRKPAAVVSPVQPVTRPMAAVGSPAAPAAGLNGTASALSTEAQTLVPSSTPAIRPTSPSVGKPKPARRAGTTATGAAQQSALTPAAVPAAQPAPPPAPPSAAPAPVERPSPGVVQLFATGAICYPAWTPSLLRSSCLATKAWRPAGTGFLHAQQGRAQGTGGRDRVASWCQGRAHRDAKGRHAHPRAPAVIQRTSTAAGAATVCRRHRRPNHDTQIGYLHKRLTIWLGRPATTG